MKVNETRLPGVLIIEPKVFGDSRGFLLETWNQDRYVRAGLPARFVQDNLSHSSRGVLRGLHFQNPKPQGKLVYVLQGEVYDVAVDVRIGSCNFGRWVGTALSADSNRQLYVPPGFAHGFCVTSDTALLAYKCTDFYDAEVEVSIRWNDPDLDIEWPIVAPVLAVKDQRAPRLKDIPHSRLPLFSESVG